MAIELANKPNVIAPGGAYPYGNIKDDTGVGDGTPVDTIVYADFHQFFARVLALSGITPNNQPDNNTNGFQYYEALVALVANGFPGAAAGEWTGITPPAITTDVGTASFFGSAAIRYKIIGKTFFWQVTGGMTFSGNPTVLNIPFPFAITPKLVFDMYYTGTFGPTGVSPIPFPLSIRINSSGAQVVRNPQTAFNFGSGYLLHFMVAFEIA